MRLRCQDGILAVVIKAPPGCINNIGRIVEVKGPVSNLWYQNKYYPCWSIQPVTSSPYTVYQGGRYVTEVVSWDSNVIQPDEWLEPLLPLDIAYELLAQAELAD